MYKIVVAVALMCGSGLCAVCVAVISNANTLISMNTSDRFTVKLQRL